MRGGIGLIIMAMSLTPVLDAVAKELGRDHAPIVICLARYLSSGLVALVLARIMGERVHPRAEDLPGHLLRAALMIGAMVAFISALSMVPMADAVGGFLIAPMVATGLSVLLLGEVVTPRKILGGLLSLLGAVIITRPGLGLQAGTLLALAGGVLLGCYFTASRAAADNGGVTGRMAIEALAGAALIAPAAISEGLPAIGGAFLAWVAVLGLVSAACHVLTLLAFRRSPAAELAPFMYCNLLVAVALGVLVFGEIPGPATLAGLGAILAGGLVTALTPLQIAALRGLALRLSRQPVPAAASRRFSMTA